MKGCMKKTVYDELDEYQRVLRHELAQSYAKKRGVDLNAAYSKMLTCCVLERHRQPRRLLGLWLVVVVSAVLLGAIVAFVGYNIFSSVYISAGLGVVTILSVTGIPFGRFYIIDIYKDFWERQLRAEVSTEVNLFCDVATFIGNWKNLDDLTSDVKQRAYSFMIMQFRFDQQRMQAGRDAAATVQLGTAYLASESWFQNAFDRAVALGVELDKGQLLEKARQQAVTQLGQKK